MENVFVCPEDEDEVKGFGKGYDSGRGIRLRLCGRDRRRFNTDFRRR